MWSLAQAERKKYARNSLESVVVQVRFHPILKLPARIGEFQERVREHFPGFIEEPLKAVELFPDGNAQLRMDRLFRFSNAGALRQLQLTMSSLTLEVKNYDRREDLAADFSLGLQALTQGIGEPSLYRLGLRFVNVLVREKIGAELGRDVPWSELVTEEFLRVPPLFDADSPRSYHELTAVLPPGALTLRYGLLPFPQQSSQVYFRFDMDRYLEGAIESHQLDSTLEKFTDDCLALFEAAVGPSLREWMEGGSHGA